MIKKLAVIVLFAVFFTAELLAQNNREDAVYLNNGSILKGKILENISGVTTSIEIVGHNLIVIPDSVIKMILVNQLIPSNEKTYSVSPVEMTSSVNFYGGTENAGGFSFVTSYRFPGRVAVGAGLGIEWFDHQQIPFLADIRYYIRKGAWSPLVYGQVGFAMPLSKKAEGDYSEYHGGPLAGIGTGMRFNFNRKNALIFSIGYKYQKIKTITNSYPWISSSQQYETIRYNEYNRLTFSFGFLFN
jgi:hypothetical protein